MNLVPGQKPDRSRWERVDTLMGSATTSIDASAASSTSFVAQMHQLPEDRKQLIFRIRRQIAENTYDVGDKLDLALSRLIDRFSRR